jgi:uracil-DNA glycosylase
VALHPLTETEPKSLAALNRLIAASEPLVPGSNRAVLGEGPMHPAMAFVGEQPGDQEDIEGHPFVGPAGQILNRAFAAAEISRKKTYLTNAVKHFKFEERGKRRIHQKPTVGEVKHYRWWLIKELEFVRPTLVVALGATAALALANKPVSVMKQRGPMTFEAGAGYVTVHPSYLLRLPDKSAKAEAFAAFVEDLRSARSLAASLAASQQTKVRRHPHTTSRS